GAWGVLAGDGLARSCYVGPVPADAPIVVDVPAGGTAKLAIDPDDGDLGQVVMGMASSDVVFTVRNELGTTGVLTAARGGRDAGDFILLSHLCTGITLSPGGTCTLKVRFTPSTTGNKAATVGVSAMPGGIVLATIHGKSAMPGVLTITPTPRDFGSALAGTPGQAATFTVRNAGEAATTVSPALAHATDFATA